MKSVYGNLHGPVDEVQIHVVSLQIFQRLRQACSRVVMERVPSIQRVSTSQLLLWNNLQLARDENLISWHPRRLDCVANLLLYYLR